MNEDFLDNPCLNIKIGTEILYKHFSRCGMTWRCLGTYNAGFAMDNQKKRLQYAQKIYIVYTRLNELDNRKAFSKMSLKPLFLYSAHTHT